MNYPRPCVYKDYQQPPLMLHQKVFRALARFLAKKNIYLSKSLSYAAYPQRVSVERLDFVRLAMLDLAANEIYSKNMKGSTAELGVYKGEFSAEINTAFPDRKLYLFDTFEGFDNRDVSAEREKGYSRGNQDFSDTSVDAVLSRMPVKQNCIVRKGYFPETAEGIDDTFVFVSIDTDLYEPIYAGLKYFYPRLAQGGFIFVHDYHNHEYPGAKEAVEKFCVEMSVAFVPFPDNGGSVVIRKPQS